MKKHFFIATLSCLLGIGLQAQTLIDNYRFDTWVDESSWIDITGQDSALVTPPTYGWITSGGFSSQLTDIGFTFPFAGTDYTTFGTSLMGAVRLGARMVGTPSGSNVLSTTATLPKIDGLGVRGMADSSCYIRCATVGTAGSRVLVVETRLGIYLHEGIYVCWQTQLFEASGEVRLVYGPSEGTSLMPATQPGLAKWNTDMLFLDFTNHSVQRFASTPVPTNATGTWPEEGRCYSFMPDGTACPAPPTVAVLNNDPDSTVLSWVTDNYATWRLRIPALGIDLLTTDTLLILSGINPTTTYNGTLQTVCGVDDSSLRIIPFTFTTTGCGTVHLLPWVDDFQLAASNDCWQKPYKTSSNRWQRQSANGNYYMRSGYSSATSTVYNEWLITPPVELPNSAGLTLNWLYKSEQNSGVSPKVCVRLLMCDSTDAVDTTDAWVTLATIESYEQVFQKHHLMLDPYAGHRVRVAFQRYGSGGKYAYVDSVGISVQAAPVVTVQAPNGANVGDTVEVAAMLIAGLPNGLQYQWTSTMEDRGEAVRISADDTLRIVYLSAGRDTVSVTLTTDYGTAIVTASYTVCGAISAFPWYEGFENGIECWEPQIGNSNWQTTTSYKRSGTYALRSNTNSGQTNLIVSQSIAVPTNAYMLRLGLWGKLSANNTTVTSPVDILIANSDCTDWSTATVLGTASVNVHYNYFDFPLDDFAGQTLRFALRHSQPNKIVFIDDIEIRFVSVPEGNLTTSSVRVYGEDTVTATTTLTEGDTVGIDYQWESTMGNNSQATLLGSGPQVSIVYHGTGIDTIVVTVSNAYGSFTDTAYVYACPVQDSLPWVVDFSNDFPCWQVIEGTCEVNSYGYLSFTGISPITVASPPLYVPTDGNVVLEYDYAYYFFYGSSQVMVTTDMITFDTIGDFPFVNGTHAPSRIPLTTYAGQQIRLIFTATGDFLQFYLFNMNIHYAFEPMVTLSVDDGYFPGTPMTLTATLLEGDTNGLTYTWTSAKELRGEATLSQDGSAHATLTCYTGGSDTVTVWATNAYGTDSAWTVVNVKPCDTVEALLWMEDFSNYYTCWWQPESSQWTLSEDPYYTMAVAINWWQPTDSWLVSRAISLPNLPADSNDELLLCWDASSQHNDTHSYCVMITSAPDYRNLSTYDTLIAYDTVLPDFSAGWSTMRVPLSAYAGQTIHLAFRYTTELYEPYGLPGVLVIDNIRIVDTTYPAPPPDTVWRTVMVLCDSTMGTVTGSGRFIDSTLVTLSASPLDGYHFTVWNDGSIVNPRQVLLVSDTSFTAYFAQDTLPTPPPVPDTVWHSASVTANVEGACVPYGGGRYADSSVVEIGYHVLDTLPTGGHWQFLGWNDGPTENPRSILVTSDTAIIALFEWVADTTEGIDEVENGKWQVEIFPNPSHGEVSIRLDETSIMNNKVWLEVINLTGHTVIPQTTLHSPLSTLHLPLAAGTYFVRIVTDDSSHIAKLIVE